MSTTDGGFVALPKFILQNPSLTPEAIVVYCQLLHFDRGSGRGCFAKRETISKFSNLSLHKVRNAIKVLEDNGIIEVVRRRNSLTDVIRITPDCRPPIKEAKQVKTHSSRTSTKAVSITRNTQEIKPFNVSTNRDNKTIQTNYNLSPNTPKGVKTNHENRVKTEHEDTIEPKPNPIHEQATNELLEKLKPLIRQRSYDVWFADIWIEKDTEKEVTLRTAKGLYMADYIKDNYLSKLETISGKRVRVIG